MNVSDIMTASPVTINKEESVYKALVLMADIGCHHLPVTGGQGHLVGVLSDHDCRRALNIAHLWGDGWQDEDNLSRRLRVGDIMTPAPIITEPNVPVEDATRLMLTHNIRCLPVMRAETLVGIITTTDVMMAFILMCQRRGLASAEHDAWAI